MENEPTRESTVKDIAQNGELIENEVNVLEKLVDAWYDMINAIKAKLGK